MDSVSAGSYNDIVKSFWNQLSHYRWDICILIKTLHDDEAYGTNRVKKIIDGIT